MAGLTIERDEVTPFLVRVEKGLRVTRPLMARFGKGLESILKDHFLAKNNAPKKDARKADWPKTNFWNQVRDRTQLVAVTNKFARVEIADRRFRIHVTGGTVRPVEKKSLCFPIHRLSYGKRASSQGKTQDGENFPAFETATGIKLFRPGKKGQKKNVLMGIVDGKPVRLFALAKSADIPKDPEALPPDEAVEEMIQDTADAWLDELADGKKST